MEEWITKILGTHRDPAERRDFCLTREGFDNMTSEVFLTYQIRKGGIWMIDIIYLTRSDLPGTSIASFARAAVKLAKESFSGSEKEEIIFTAVQMLYSNDLSDAQLRVNFSIDAPVEKAAKSFMELAKEYIKEEGILVVTSNGSVMSHERFEYP